MSLSAVLLHYRGGAQVDATLRALIPQIDGLGDICVVDNASLDGSAARLRQDYPEVTVREMPGNRGYASGMNAGIQWAREAGADAVLLLTQECVLAPGAVAAMAERLRDAPSVGAVGPLLGRLSARDRVWSAGGRVDPRTWDLLHIREPAAVREWEGAAPHQVEWLDGACILLRPAAVEAAGQLDERYFLYLEEAEYLLRLGRRGWSVECVPAALGWQEPGEARTMRLWTRNRLLFVAQTAPRRLLARELGRLTYHVVRKKLRPGSEADREVAAQRAAGMLDFLRRRWGPTPPR